MAKQKEELIITVLIGLLGAIIIFLMIQAFRAMNTTLFAPLIIIIVLLILIAAALFYHTRLIKSLSEKKGKKSGFVAHLKEDRDSIAALERKLFGDITDTMRKLEKK